MKSPVIRPSYLNIGDLQPAESHDLSFLYKKDANGKSLVRSVTFCLKCSSQIFSDASKQEVGLLPGARNHERCSNDPNIKKSKVTCTIEADEEVIGFDLGFHSLADLKEVSEKYPNKAKSLPLFFIASITVWTPPFK